MAYRSYSSEDVENWMSLRNAGLSNAEISRRTGVPTTTLQRKLPLNPRKLVDVALVPGWIESYKSGIYMSQIAAQSGYSSATVADWIRASGVKKTDIIRRDTKKCNKCGLEKAISDFHKDRTKKGGITNTCKPCKLIENTEYAKTHVEELKTAHKKYNNVYYPKRLAEDPAFKLKFNLRKRISDIVSGRWKPGSAVKDLGCSVDELMVHLEKSFYSNPETGEVMSWENYGQKGWHVDHIIPLSRFDLTDREQFLEACHYTNLQALWAKDNYAKKDRLDWKRAA